MDSEMTGAELYEKALDLEAENKQLQAENARLKEELDTWKGNCAELSASEARLTTEWVESFKQIDRLKTLLRDFIEKSHGACYQRCNRKLSDCDLCGLGKLRVKAKAELYPGEIVGDCAGDTIFEGEEA